MDQLLGASITYRIAVGPQRGRKVFTLQTLPAWDDRFGDEVGKVSGFSLHAGVMARADERQKLERLCRYVSRPAVSEKRLSLTANGQVRYQLKTPYRDGTTHVIFEPLDQIAGSDFEQPKVGPKGAGQDARSNSSPAWPRWCLSPESTSRALLVSSLILTRFAGQLKLSKFIPDEFVMACLPRTANTVHA